MTAPSKETLAIYGNLLPLIMPWKRLAHQFEVLSLDESLDGWDTFLAAQGINVRQQTKHNETFQAQCVITWFSAPEKIAQDSLSSRASDILAQLKPGGLLVIGGYMLGNKALGTQETSAVSQMQLHGLKKAGFERSCVVTPNLRPSDRSFASALHTTNSKFAVVGQKQATGKAFDMFTPLFMHYRTPSPKKRLIEAEHALYARIHTAETHLNDRISHLDKTFCDRSAALETNAQQLGARLARQEEEIRKLGSELVDLRTKLKRATRRRGLRKLAHTIKTSLRPKSEPQAQSENTQQVRASEPTPVVSARPVTPEPAGKTSAMDPTPLSPQEADLYNRLFDKEPD